jgi:hypothetical protein
MSDKKRTTPAGPNWRALSVWGVVILLVCILAYVELAGPIAVAWFPEKGAARLAPPYPSAQQFGNSVTRTTLLGADYTETTYTTDASFDIVLDFYKRLGGKVTRGPGIASTSQATNLVIKPDYASVTIVQTKIPSGLVTMFTIKTRNG